MYRVFFSHPAEDASWATRVAFAFDRPPLLQAFVAGRDIQSGHEWLTVLETELMRCHALVAMLGPAFRGSEWCDQEVGFALGAKKKVVPMTDIRPVKLPHGFISRLQVLDVAGLSEQATADRLFDCLYDDARERPALTPVVLTALANDREPADVRKWAQRLERWPADLTDDQQADLARTLARNSTLRADRVSYAIVTRIVEGYNR